jgi:hypothetical protein
MFNESRGDNSMCMFKGKQLYVSSMIKRIQLIKQIRILSHSYYLIINTFLPRVRVNYNFFFLHRVRVEVRVRFIIR